MGDKSSKTEIDLGPEIFLAKKGLGLSQTCPGEHIIHSYSAYFKKLVLKPGFIW